MQTSKSGVGRHVGVVGYFVVVVEFVVELVLELVV